MELINWLGNLALACCSLPLAYRAWKDRSIKIDLLFLLLWTLGELCVMIYVVSKGEAALSLNYFTNLAALTVVWRYRTC